MYNLSSYILKIKNKLKSNKRDSELPSWKPRKDYSSVIETHATKYEDWNVKKMTKCMHGSKSKHFIYVETMYSVCWVSQDDSKYLTFNKHTQ